MNAPDRTQRMRPDIEKILGLGKSTASSPLQSWMPRIKTGAAIATALALILYFGFGGSKNTVKYITQPAIRADLIVIVTATGTVQPTNEVEISSELSGTIRKVLVDYNSTVKVGQSLAELDTDKLKATVESARAKLTAANARVKDAEATVNEKKLDYERQRRLADRKITSEHNLEIAKASYERAMAALDSAKADVAAAAADLRLNETNLAKTCICSPINGVVLSRNVEPGQFVASSFQAPVLFTIAEDLTKMEVQVDVDEADVGTVKEGQPARFTVDAYPDKTFPAKIKELRYGSEVVQGVVTYKAVLTTNNTQLLLRPGMTATAEITVQDIKNVVSIPNQALRFSPPTADGESDNRSFLQKLLPGRPRLRPASQHASSGPERQVWVLVDGAPKPVAVTVGPSDGQRTQIVKGDIASGQAVIVDTVTAAN